jgi:exonuclease III
MSDTINICLYNAQSYNNKYISINQCIQSNKIDILCLNETFLNEKITHVNLMNNYSMVRNDRQTRGGGVAFIINNRINYEKPPKINSTNDYEYISIEIISANEKITLLNTYTHPKSNTNYNFIQSFLKSTSNKVICVGDMNATNISWFCNNTNRRGKCLESLCERNNLQILNSNIPTSQKSTNIIDLIICSEPLIHRISDIVVDHDFDISDHWPVRFKLSFSPGKEKVKKINWVSFKADMDLNYANQTPIIHNIADLENSSAHFSQTILNIVEKNTTQVEKGSHKVKIPTHIFNLIKEKNKLQRLFSKNHDPEIKNLINNKSNKIKRHIMKLMNDK